MSHKDYLDLIVTIQQISSFFFAFYPERKGAFKVIPYEYLLFNKL